MKMAVINFKSSILVLSFLMLIFSCNNAKKEWEKTQQQNTVESFNSFIEKYPESEFIQEAKLKIIDLEWEKTLKDNNIKSFKAFISKYPVNKYLDEANAKIEKFEWAHVLANPNLDTLYYYIKKYPKSPNILQAKEEISKIKWPPIKVNSANRLYIWSNGKQASYGFPFLYLTPQGTLEFGDNDRAIIIWRDFTPEQEENSLKNGICTGIAYLWQHDGNYRFIKKVDLQKTDNQLKKEFGIVE